MPKPEENTLPTLPPLPVVHSDLDEYGLDPYEFRIYAHVVRRTGGKLTGECFAKLKKTSEICHMSVRKAQYSFSVLCKAGLLTKESRPGRSDIYKLTPKSDWLPRESLLEIRKNVKSLTFKETDNFADNPKVEEVKKPRPKTKKTSKRFDWLPD